MLYAAQDQAPSAEGKVSVFAHAHTHARAHTPAPSGLFGHPQNNRPSSAKNSQKSLLPLTSPGCNASKKQEFLTLTFTAYFFDPPPLSVLTD